VPQAASIPFFERFFAFQEAQGVPTAFFLQRVRNYLIPKELLFALVQKSP